MLIELDVSCLRERRVVRKRYMLERGEGGKGKERKEREDRGTESQREEKRQNRERGDRETGFLTYQRIFMRSMFEGPATR
jgi:hypothetical protein